MSSPSTNEKTLSEFILHQEQRMQVQDFVIPGLNTATLFGESAFISFRTYNGKIANKEKQVERLVHSAEYLDFETDSEIWEEIQDSIDELSQEYLNHYFRVTLFSYLNGSIDFFIWVKPMEANLKQTVKLKSMEVKNPLFFQDVKIGHYAEIFRVGRRGQALYPEYDEILLVDPHEEIFEAATSNFFCLHNGKLISPSFENGVYKGIFISEFMRYMDDLQLPREIRKLTLGEVLKEKYSCFICNSVKGVRQVVQIDDVSLQTDPKDVEIINNYLREVGGYEKIITG